MSYSDRPPERDRTGADSSSHPYRHGQLPAYNYEIEQQQLRQAAQEREYQRLRFEEDRIARTRRQVLAQRLIQAVAYLATALEILLGLRFLLRLLAANTTNTFASTIFSWSEPFVSPFSTLFISPTFNGSTNIFDVNLLVAMLTYLLLTLLAVWLIRLVFRR
ncbi:MAG TPA: YggT family protein [Leptolyngbyaceae cyanobacterium]